MTTEITPRDKQSTCPSEFGPKHTFILLSPGHSDTSPYGCARCPETRLGADLDTDPPIVYRVTGERHVARYMFGITDGTVTQIPVTQVLADTVAEALNEAVRRGAAHGVCDTDQEKANALTGKPNPGHIVYEPTNVGHDRVVVAWEDGTPKVIISGIKPYNFNSDFARELQNAFLMGGFLARLV